MTTTHTDLWSQVHDERRALLDLLETLSPEQWDTPSLCEGWGVRDVVGHLIGGTQVSLPQMVGPLLLCGFRLNRYLLRDGRRRGACPAPVLVTQFRDRLETRTTPPGLNAADMLEDVVLHQLDIRRPLGIARPVPVPRLQAVTANVARHRMFPARRLVAGLRFRATDCDWSIGSGPTVSGPMESIALVLSGRFVAVEELTGEGLPALTGRTPARMRAESTGAAR